MTPLRRHFDEHGYVILHGFFDEPDLAPFIAEYEQLLDRVARAWMVEGSVRDDLAGLPFNERFPRLTHEYGRPYSPFFDISLPSRFNAGTPIHLGDAVFDLLVHPRLLDAVEALIGPEIYVNPMHRVRIKPPERWVHGHIRNGQTAASLWHQDQAAALPEADETDMVTVWCPVTDALEEHSCMRVAPGVHHAPMLDHQPGMWFAPSELPSEPVTLPMRRGDVLLLHRRTPHASTPNVSDQVRVSFDFRYQPIDQPTGRPFFPGFVARSRRHPERVCVDAAAWRQSWLDTRARLADQTPLRFYRNG
jgi:ectoine hydroxylase-related dioxygenase (phytanoyl-CoA dioxygenase family)